MYVHRLMPMARTTPMKRRLHVMNMVIFTSVSRRGAAMLKMLPMVDWMGGVWGVYGQKTEVCF